MKILYVIEIIIVIICAVTYGLMLYFKVKGNITAVVSEFIALAEQTGLCGSEKMAQVVSALYEKVPKCFKRLLSEDKLEKIAQRIFDWMRQYADEYIKKQTNSDTCTALSTDELAVQFSSLMKLKLAELKQMAEDEGICLEDGSTRESIIRELIAHALNKA